jgi:hypothetical protein
MGRIKEERPPLRRAAPFPRFQGRYVPGPVAFMRLQPSRCTPPPPIGEGGSRPDLSTPDESGDAGSIPLFRGAIPCVHHDDPRGHLPLTVVPLSPCHPLSNHDPIHSTCWPDETPVRPRCPPHGAPMPSLHLPPGGQRPGSREAISLLPKAGAVPDPYLLSISLGYNHLEGRRPHFRQQVRVL